MRNEGEQRLQQQQREWETRFNTEKQLWVQSKEEVRQQPASPGDRFDKVKEVEKYWQEIVLPEKEQEWRKAEKPRTEALIDAKVHEVEKEFNERIIPSVLREQKASWDN